jgi:outer membrane biosynthesis protein TonB
MRKGLLRFLRRISAALPDIRHLPPRRQMVGALVVAIGLHGAAFLLMGVLGWLFPGNPAALAEASPAMKTVEWVLPPPEPERVPLLIKEAPDTLPVADSEGLAKSEKAPEAAVFQSSQNMRAASERPGDGSIPLPSQDGANLPFTQFKNQSSRNGTPRDSEAAAEPAPPAKAPPTADPRAVSEPKVPAYRVNPMPQKEVETLARLEPTKKTPLPLPDEPASPPDAVKPPEPANDPQRGQPPQPQRSDAFQPELRKTRVEGNISNRGRPAVDAIRTPLGVYRQKLGAQIHSRWNYYRAQTADLHALGTVRIRFFVDRSGKIQDVAIIENNSNQTFGDVCERSVREAEIPPPPRDLELMKDGRLEMVFSFTLYSAQ